jgi:xanthosine utilization system XapX-like protein
MIPVTPLALRTLLETAGAPPHVAELVGQLDPAVVARAGELIARLLSGEPLGSIVRAQAPDPDRVFAEVDAEQRDTFTGQAGPPRSDR